MKLQVLQENLSKALTTASRFTSTRAQLPVLGNILFTAKKNKLVISSTNLEVSISLSVGAQIKKEGEITIPSRTITDLVNNLPKEVVNIKVSKEQAKVSSENFSSNVSAMNSADFPSIPQSVGKKSLKLPQEEFVKALSKVLFAASIDETRPVLTGVLFIFKKNNLFMVATDGFRLSQKKIAFKKKSKKEKVILPKNALNELVRLAGSGEDDISFSLKGKDNQVIFGFDGTVLSSRVLEGEFPNYEKIIPEDKKFEVSVDKEEFLRAVKLGSVFARDAANIVKLSLKKDSLKVSAESQQSGQQEMDIDAKVDGELKKGFEIAFNYRFLEEYLNVVEGEDVVMEFSEQNSPGVFRDPEDKDYLHLVMPVKIQS